MKILVLGPNGQIGYELQRSLLSLGHLKLCDRKMVDLSKLDDLRSFLFDYHPDIIVNAAAYTTVDLAETEPNQAYNINAEAVGVMAENAKKLDAWLIHYSTDYIFDGKKKGAYTEIDKTNPLSIYGETKLQGELAIKASACKHLIFRTSWLYSARRTNFVKTILHLAKKQNKLNVVNDQIGSPTSAKLIADVTSLCLFKITEHKVSTQNINGIYNIAAANETSWYDFAKHIISKAQDLGVVFLVKPENINSINSSELNLPAKRPINSTLNTQKLRDTFKLDLPSWQILIGRVLKELYLK